jgi:long-chain acyl-CoA synthetase
MSAVDPAVGPLTAWYRHLDQQPQAVAVQYLDRAFTCTEIDGRANGFAAALVDRGVGAGDHVIVAVQNTPHFPVAVLGAWKVGAVIVPLNVMYRADELRHAVLDSGATVIVCAEELVGVLLEAGLPEQVHLVVQCGDAEWRAGEPGASTPPAPAVVDMTSLLDHTDAPMRREVPAPDSRAVLAYTSGTSGASKGVVLTHANLAVNGQVAASWLTLSGYDVILAIAPMFHITGLVTYFCTSLHSGATILLGGRFHPSTFLGLASKYGATCTVAPITAFIAMMNDPSFADHDLSRFTKLVSGGAPTPVAVVEKYLAATGVYICNAYGLTETSSVALRVPLGDRAPVDPEFGALSVGTPTGITEARVVDVATRRVLEDGEEGELELRGPHVTAGYHRKPAETAAAIVDGWFRTGDVARQKDGWYFIVDRLKDVIIASGFKVWPREVEDCLHAHPAVREVAVVGEPDAYRGETVVAYTVVHGEASADELARHCRERLAAFKCPTSFRFVEAIPKTASGKVLRRVLRRENGSVE